MADGLIRLNSKVDTKLAALAARTDIKLDGITTRVDRLHDLINSKK